MIIRCAFCQDDFTPRNSRVRCCSKLCGSRLHYIENRDRLLAYAKEHRNQGANKRYYEANRQKQIEWQRAYRRRKAAERAAPARS
jgi:hypothetical protein